MEASVCLKSFLESTSMGDETFAINDFSVCVESVVATGWTKTTP